MEMMVVVFGGGSGSDSNDVPKDWNGCDRSCSCVCDEHDDNNDNVDNLLIMMVAVMVIMITEVMVGVRVVTIIVLLFFVMEMTTVLVMW